MISEDWRGDGTQYASKIPRTNDFSVCNPSGFNVNAQTVQFNVEAEGAVDQQEHLKRKRAWDLAISPAKSIPMNLFMMYMAGRSISIFPIMMIAMMLWRPLKALLGVNSTFQHLEETGSLVFHKIAYVIGNLAVVCLAIYKVHTMGLLPTYDSDWLEFIPERSRQQYSLVGDIYT